MLGEGAAKVIEVDQVEQARLDAGISFERFTPRVEHGLRGEVKGVGLLIQPVGANDGASEEDGQGLWFDEPSALDAFSDRLRRRIEQGSQCCFWQGHELEIEGDTPGHLVQLERWHRAWTQPQLWTADELFDRLVLKRVPTFCKHPLAIRRCCQPG